MKGAKGDKPLLKLHADLLPFMRLGVSIIAASSGPENLPALARCRGCRVSADMRRLTVLLSGSQHSSLVEAVRKTGSIAVVFSQPSTHRTFQLKGSDASVTPIEDGDVEISELYVPSFTAELVPLGYKAEWVHAMLWCDKSDLVAVTFTPSAAFLQTPGPKAGVRLPA